MTHTLALSLAALATLAAAGPKDSNREVIKRALDEKLKASALESARVGLHVVSLADGTVLYSHNADELLNPASNVKLFTAATALARLGPEYRYLTEVYTQKPLERGGVVKGSLYLKGRGDPSLVSERLWKIAAELWHQGLRKVQGDLIVDDSFFDEVREGPGWEQERSDRAYMAPVGALSLNYNAVAIYVHPADVAGQKARVEVDPMSAYFQIENQITTTRRRALRRIIPASIGAGDHQRIQVRGRIPVERDGSVFYRKIDNPPIYAGETLKKLLADRGVTISGKVKRGTVPPEAAPFYAAESPPLAEILRDLNKYSSNFVAEMLVKTLGAELKGTPGSWEGGIAVIEEYLAEIGIAPGSYVMKNGSGLNDTNRFSARQIATLLADAQRRFPTAAEFVGSLGIAARDGTLKTRMEGTEAAGRVRGKTGTLENVAALSGYLPGQNGEILAFAMMANDFPGKSAPVISAMDGAISALAGLVALGTPRPGEALARSAEPADLKARVATYLGLAKLHDRRNLPFLRTALRSEKDPAVRVVVAEALYLSDPDDSSGARALLDAFQPAAELMGQLRSLGPELALPTPVVPSLLGIAAEGNAEALGRILEIAPLAHEDDALASLLAEGIAEVGRNAPEELAEALISAGESASDALALIARGVPRSERAQHPTLAALKKAAAGDGENTALARAAWERLEAELNRPEPVKAPAAAGAPAAPLPDARPGGG